MIDMENLQLAIDGSNVLRGVDLHLRRGDTYGLLGPNGAGKSTTIYALLGLRAYGSGRLRVMGDDPARDPVPIRRMVGVMPEKAAFYDWMSASGYLDWYGRLYGSAPSESDLTKVLQRVGLGKAVHRPIGTYSRGMKQRLAVARALMARPKLLILDEPTNGLDPQGRREIHDLLGEFVADGTSGVLLCTHLLDDVDRLCNRIGIIDKGRTRLEGSPRNLLSAGNSVQRFRLCLENGPQDPPSLPAGAKLLGHEGGWWRVEVDNPGPEGLSALWGELWRRGWKIAEIRCETSSLEKLYLSHIDRDSNRSDRVAS